jgi:hypothetical protein
MFLRSVLLSILALSMLSFAKTEVSVDLEKLGPQSRDAVLNVVASSQDTNIIQKVMSNPGQLTSFAKELGGAVAEVCKALNVGVNDFVKTPVGILTTGIILYKVVGRDIIHYTIGSLFFLITLTLWLFSWQRSHTCERIVTKIDQIGNKVRVIDVKYVPRHTFHDSDARSISAGLHVTMLCVIIIITCIILFA